MKIGPFLFLLALAFSACSNSPTTENSTQNDESAKETLCFQRLEGTANQDTSFIHLVINNKEVSGDFNHIPYEKDSRKGTITGSKDGNIIKGVWTYMQEGMQDTLSVEFKIDGNTLLQKNYSINPQTGRQFLSDTSKFAIEYKKTECN